jgi:uncharacterized protein involved in exopolysaccharide biosynthesis
MPDTPTTLALLLREVRRHPVWLLGCTLVLGLLGWVTATLLDPAYTARGVLAIAQGATRYDYFAEPSELSTEPDIDREVQFLRSRQLLAKVYPRFAVGVDDLDRYWPRMGGLGLRVPVPGTEPRLRLSPAGDQEFAPFQWRLRFLDEDRVRLTDEDGGLSGEYAIADGQLEVGGIRLRVERAGKLAGGRFMVAHRRLDDWIRRTQRELTASPSARNAHVVMLSFRDSDPYRAAEMVDALMEAYEEHYITRFAEDAGGQVPALLEQLAEAEARLEAAEQARAAHEAETLSFEPELRATGLFTTLEAVETQRALAEARAILFRDLALDPDSERPIEQVAAILRVSPEDDAYLAALLAEIAASTPGSDEEAALRQRLSEGIRHRATAMFEELRSWDQALVQLRMEIAAFPPAAAKQRQLAREVLAREAHHLFVSTRLQEARLAERTRTASVAMIDGATVPDRRDGPFVGAYLAVGLLAGFLLGAVILIYRHPRP